MSLFHLRFYFKTHIVLITERYEVRAVIFYFQRENLLLCFNYDQGQIDVDSIAVFSFLTFIFISFFLSFTQDKCSAGFNLNTLE